MPIISFPNPAEAPMFVDYTTKFPGYIAAFSMKMRPWKAACSLLRAPCLGRCALIGPRSGSSG